MQFNRTPVSRAALRLSLVVLGLAALRAPAQDTAVKPPALSTGTVVRTLFDGRSFAGWEGDTNRTFRIVGAAIVAGSLHGNPRNEFLATTRAYRNFSLRFEYKLVGAEGFVNGGVQFRSTRTVRPPNEMSGYQADIGAGHSGCLYDESRRNRFLARATDAAIKRLEKPGDWNRCEIHADGPRIRLVLNGEQTVDYTETEAGIPDTGSIALQIHGGCKAELSFRNISLTERP